VYTAHPSHHSNPSTRAPFGTKVPEQPHPLSSLLGFIRLFLLFV
jgi:hypothetical protein